MMITAMMLMMMMAMMVVMMIMMMMMMVMMMIMMVMMMTMMMRRSWGVMVAPSYRHYHLIRCLAQQLLLQHTVLLQSLPNHTFFISTFVDMSLECCAHNIMSKLKAVVQRIGRTSRTRSNGAIFYRWPSVTFTFLALFLAIFCRWPSVTFTFLAEIIRWNARIPKYEFILYHTC